MNSIAKLYNNLLLIQTEKLTITARFADPSPMRLVGGTLRSLGFTRISEWSESYPRKCKVKQNLFIDKNLEEIESPRLTKEEWLAQET